MHNSFMLAALEQAWLGRGSCAPNPSVGAVAVYEGKIIARGSHCGAGTPHAEQVCLEQIPNNLKGVCLYVTLEPCNHWGKTPPCVGAIIEHHVAEIIYGYSDPNPIVRANNTPKQLIEAGVKVVHFPLEEINQFYESYYHWTLTKKPWVCVKLAQTLDGKIALEHGERIQLSNEACKDFTHQNRYHADILLTTAKTIRNDDPQFNVRMDGCEFKKPIAVLDSKLSLPLDKTIFKNATCCHVFYDERIKSPTNYPMNVYFHPTPTRDGLLQLEFIFSHLGALGYHDVWVEAGGQLFSALHREELVQCTYLYLTPHILGESATTAFHNMTFAKQKKIEWLVKEDNVIARIKWGN